MHFHELETELSDSKENKFEDLKTESIEMIKQSQKFYFGEIEGIPKSRYSNLKNFQLPYDCCAFEFLHNNGIKTIILLKNNRLTIYSKVNRTWHWFASSSIDVEKNVSHTSYLPGSSVAAEKILDSVNDFICLIFDSLSVLNCTNVSTEKIIASEKLNKKRVKNNKLPIYEYKVLVLKRQNKILHALGGTHASPRVHLRRGHIKHLKSGDFWWQPCVVGNREKGLIVKDYRADRLFKKIDCHV